MDLTRHCVAILVPNLVTKRDSYQWVYCVSGRDFGDLTRRCMAILVLVLVVAWVSDQPHLGGGLDVHGPCTQPRNMV